MESLGGSIANFAASLFSATEVKEPSLTPGANAEDPEQAASIAQAARAMNPAHENDRCI